MILAFGILVVALTVIILLGFPVAFGVGIISMVGAMVIYGDILDPRVPSMIARLGFDKINDFMLLGIPFFLLAGRLMNTGSITERLFNFVSTLVRPVPGGLAHANVLASVVFAGMSGSGVADVAGLGSIEMKAMLKQGYDRRFSAGVTGASALIGPIIPPSIPLVAYAVQAEVSVAAMFFGGIVPGLLLALGFLAWISFCARGGRLPAGPLASVREIAVSFIRAVFPLLTPVIIIGGIYSGIFTPTEAAAVAVAYAAILSGVVYREFGIRALGRAIKEAMIDSAVVMAIVAFTSAFGVLLIRGHIPTALAEMLSQMTSDGTTLMLLFVALWMVVGCFMSETPALLILTPVLLPTAQQFGIDPIHFGVVMIVALTVGLVTPPVGMVLYVLSRVSEVPFEQLLLPVLPYIVISLFVVLLLILFPQLVLFLPGILMQ